MSLSLNHISVVSLWVQRHRWGMQIHIVITWQGPYGPCQVKQCSLQSQQFCQHILHVKQSEEAFGWMFCALVCVALCVITKYKTTLYKFNWLKDKLPSLDSSAFPADQAHHAVRAVRVKIWVKTSCPGLDRPTGKQRPEEFYRVNSGHLLVAWQTELSHFIVLGKQIGCCGPSWSMTIKQSPQIVQPFQAAFNNYQATALRVQLQRQLCLMFYWRLCP